MIAGLLLVICTHAFSTRFSMSVAAHQIQKQTGLTDVQIGSILSAFILGYAVVQFPTGILVDRLGPYRVLLLSIFGWSGFTLLTGAVGSLEPSQWSAGLIASRFAAGAAQAGVLTCAIKSVGRWMPHYERATANGLTMMGLGLGGALTPSLMVWLTGTHDWLFAFFCIGGAGIAIAILWWLFATDMPERHRFVNSSELHLIRAGKNAPADPQASRANWKVLFRNRSVWALALSYGLAGYTSYVFFTWFFLYLVKVRHMTLQEGGTWGGLPYVAVAFGSLAGGRACDILALHLGKRRGRLIVVLSGEAVAGLLIVIGARIEHTFIAVISISLAAGFHLLAQTASWAAVIDLAPVHAGILFGTMNTFAQIAGTIAPVATPAIASRFGWVTALDVAAALLVLSASLWLLVNPTKPVTADPGL